MQYHPILIYINEGLLRMNNVKKLISFLLFSSVLVAACGAPRQPSPESYARPQQNKQSQNINQQIIQETLSTSSSTSYLIGPGDLLDIKILQAPELSLVEFCS